MYAVNLKTGKVKWEKKYNAFQIGPNGVAWVRARVCGQLEHERSPRLIVKNGDELWSTKLTATPTEGVEIQPTVVAGLVLASTTPISLAGQYKGGDRGVLWALDARTGERAGPSTP